MRGRVLDAEEPSARQALETILVQELLQVVPRQPDVGQDKGASKWDVCGWPDEILESEGGHVRVKARRVLPRPEGGKGAERSQLVDPAG